MGYPSFSVESAELDDLNQVGGQGGAGAGEQKVLEMKCVCRREMEEGFACRVLLS